MNYLALEPLLVEKIKALNLFNDVLSSEQLSKITEENQSTPSAHIAYLGDVIQDTKEGGLASKVKQRWMVVIAVQTFDGTETLSEAGELMGAVLQQLQGWVPSKCFTPLHRESSGTAPLYRNGYGYFPLLFTTNMNIRGQRK